MVQVVSSIVYFAPPTRIRAVISDGLHSCNCVLATELTPLVRDDVVCTPPVAVL